MIELPSFILEILQKLDHQGFRSYVVGGSIRDLLLHKAPKDWDICTPATPLQIKEVFPNHYALGEKYGTIGVKTEQGIVQITTFRNESSYHNFRHPQVNFIASLEEDLQRRDFSVNAIAYHPQEGLIDPFNGREDLKSNLLRCIGDPNIRFQEDALRILRLMRFSATLNFQVQESTYQSAFANAKLLQNISQERIKEELLPILKSKALPTIFSDYRDVFKLILPELNKVRAHNINNPALLFGFLLSSKEDITALKRLKFDKTTIERTLTLLTFKNSLIPEDKVAIKKLLHKIGYDHFLALLELQKLLGKNTKPLYKITQNIMIADECFTLKDLKINGTRLQSLGINGEKIGEILNQLLNEVIEDKLPNQESILTKRVKELI